MSSSINLANLGQRIRAARLARRMTLEEVVSRADFTVSWLSKLENGQLTPSLEGLVKLAQALECGIDALVAGLTTPPRFVAVRQGEGRIEPLGKARRNGSTIEHRADQWRGRSMHPVILHIAGDGTKSAPDSHTGERFLLVLEGKLRLEYGDELLTLAEGDSVYLHAAIPHTLQPLNHATTVKVLSVAYEHFPTPPPHQGEAMQVKRPRARGTRAGSSRAPAD
jgi:transcriptional regulator with XRE-family HTH domain